MTIRAGVIGYPIAHSLSPRIHGYWLNKYKIDGTYDAIEVAPQDLKIFLNSLPAKGFYGVNLTLPHKVEALKILGNIDPFAQFIGAVNTIIIKDGNFIGTNTDFIGFARNLTETLPEFDVKSGPAFILGAGGAARAVIFALLSLGAPEIHIFNRSTEKADEIRKNAIDKFELANDKIITSDWNNRSESLGKCALLVNCTSLGMKGKDPLVIDLSLLPKDSVVCDIVYNPLMTDLLSAAERRGNRIIDGLGMLLHQAAPAFEAWFGIKPEITVELREEIIKCYSVF